MEAYIVKQLNEILTKDDFKAKATFLVVRKCKFLRKPLFPIKHGCHVVETTNTLVKRQVQRITKLYQVLWTHNTWRNVWLFVTKLVIYVLEFCRPSRVAHPIGFQSSVLCFTYLLWEIHTAINIDSDSHRRGCPAADSVLKCRWHTCSIHCCSFV